jgi:hypothetical protein
MCTVRYLRDSVVERGWGLDSKKVMEVALLREVVEGSCTERAVKRKINGEEAGEERRGEKRRGEEREVEEENHTLAMEQFYSFHLIPRDSRYLRKHS